MNLWRAVFVLIYFPLALAAGTKKPKTSVNDMPPIEDYLSHAAKTPADAQPSVGSLFRADGLLADMGRDLRASRRGDLVTIFVSDNANAVSTGVSNTARKSSVAASVTSLAGPKSATGALANLATTANNQQLQAQGTTSRQTTLTTNVTAEVVAVTPNGNLIVEAHKWILINSEHQEVILRGILRPVDLALDNSVSSDRIYHLEVLVNGKGVVNDAIKRPFILYRILLGLLPF